MPRPALRFRGSRFDIIERYWVLLSQEGTHPFTKARERKSLEKSGEFWGPLISSVISSGA